MTRPKIQLRRQEVWVIAISALTILLSVLVTLWVKGFIFNTGQTDQGYQNITLTDAVIQCQNAIRAQHKERLQSLAVDDLSSRFDNKANLYRIFFNAEITKSARDSSSSSFHTGCQVDARNGKIIVLEILQKNDPGTQPSDKDRNPFGWP